MVDFKHRIVTLASRTTAGTQDFTVSGFGTPTAWIVTVSETVSGIVLGTAFGYKPTALTVVQESSAQAATDNDTLAIWATDTASASALALNYLGATIGTHILEADGDTITDGIQLDYTIAPAAALTVRVDLIQCDAAFVGTTVLAGGASISTPGFQPNFFFGTSAGGAAGFGIRYGMAVDSPGGIVQCSLAMNSGNNNAPTQVHQRINTNHFFSLLAGIGATNNDWTLDSFDANGFTYSRDNGATTGGIRYLLLRVVDVDLWCGALTTPTTAVPTTYTDPGFGVGGGWVFPTFAATAGSSLLLGNNGTLGSGSFTDFEQFGATTSTLDNADPTVTDSKVSSTSAFLANDDTGALAIEGVVSPASGGFSVNFLDTDSTARYFLCLVYAAADVFSAVEETMNLSEEVRFVGRSAISEQLSISEEVVFFVLHAIPGESGVTGEGGQHGVVTGEGGYHGVADGS